MKFPLVSRRRHEATKHENNHLAMQLTAVTLQRDKSERRLAAAQATIADMMATTRRTELPAATAEIAELRGRLASIAAMETAGCANIGKRMARAARGDA